MQTCEISDCLCEVKDVGVLILARGHRPHSGNGIQPLALKPRSAQPCHVLPILDFIVPLELIAICQIVTLLCKYLWFVPPYKIQARAHQYPFHCWACRKLRVGRDFSCFLSKDLGFTCLQFNLQGTDGHLSEREGVFSSTLH